MLRERARKLIADARQGIITASSLDSPVSMASNSTTNSTNTPVMSPLESGSTFENMDGSVNNFAYHKYMIKSDFDKTKATTTSTEVRPSSANSDTSSNNKGIALVLLVACFLICHCWYTMTLAPQNKYVFHFLLILIYFYFAALVAKLFEFNFYKFNQSNGMLDRVDLNNFEY